MLQKEMSRRVFTSLLGIGAAGLILGAAGCHATKKEYETIGSDKVRTTKGESMEWVSDRKGQVIIFDDETAKVVHKQEIHKGDKVVVDPKANTLTINDQDIKVSLEKSHRYNIYVK
jgi:membrane-bound ClpP family serine protease